MSKIDFQELAKQVPKYYQMHDVYQSVWYKGEQIIKGTRDDMHKRMSLIRLEDIKDKIVVDIGCNLGAASIWAIENGAKKCLGFDVAKEGIELANTIAKELKVNCEFGVEDFGLPQKKYADVAFCFACHDDVTHHGEKEREIILLDNLKKYKVIYFETHLKGTFDNWDMPKIIRDNFKVEYLGETGEGNLRRDFYRLS